jgi:hypothetical protein
MLVDLVKDPTGAFMIGGGNRRLTVGTVENQHVNRA